MSHAAYQPGECCDLYRTKRGAKLNSMGVFTPNFVSVEFVCDAFIDKLLKPCPKAKENKIVSNLFG